MFPFSFTFSRPIPSLNDVQTKQVIHALTEYVKKHRGKNISTNNSQVHFTIGFFGTAWELFAQIEKGTFSVGDNSLCFTFYMYHLWLFAAFGGVAFAVISGNMITGLVCFLWLAGLNIIVATFRYYRMIQSIASKITKLAINAQNSIKV